MIPYSFLYKRVNIQNGKGRYPMDNGLRLQITAGGTFLLSHL